MTHNNKLAINEIAASAAIAPQYLLNWMEANNVSVARILQKYIACRGKTQDIMTAVMGNQDDSNPYFAELTK